MAADGLTLKCPIRGRLKASARSADGLRPSEEKLRVDAIRHLVSLGYPKENIKVEAVIKKFGHGGKNSFRADLAVLDVSVGSIPANVDAVLEHAILLWEVKRENTDYEQAKNTQVEPMLDFALASHDGCVALYWDDVEQRVFWRERDGGAVTQHEGPLALSPRFGDGISADSLTYNSIGATDSLLNAFKRIEDILHAGSFGPERRYGVMLQLLLAKLFDEHSHEAFPDTPLDLQDFRSLGTAGTETVKRVKAVVEKAVQHYGKYLPQPIEKKIPLSGETLALVMEILAPIKVTASRHTVIQQCYMYFAKGLYKWDLGQYFTPTTVIDFIVAAVSPQFGEHVKDPACGSADFLTAAFRAGRKFDPNFADNVWGVDESEMAVQVAVLNMLLNGDGKTNIEKRDSLATIGSEQAKFEVLLCNPPFGKSIQETRQPVLAQFDLGHVWERDDAGRLRQTETIQKKQQIGILFAEACVKLTRPGGRIGIILPNGYLGNRSVTYAALRHYLLTHCRVASICAFPRFTFKTSGADVGASVVFLEKRKQPLAHPRDSDDYPVNFEVIDKVGWDVRNKRAEPIYVREALDGSYRVGVEGELILDADFESILSDMAGGDAALEFPWLCRGRTPGGPNIASIRAAEISADPHLTLDPKRYSRKVRELEDSLEKLDHLRLGEIVDFIPEKETPSGARAELVPEHEYRYVEIEKIGRGDYTWSTQLGWQLPDRARRFPAPRDILVGSIWSSVTKWCLASGDVDHLVVTNGCHHLRLKHGSEEHLVDLAVACSSEAYAVQMRARARGSDGLAEITEEDAASVIVPIVKDPNARQRVEELLAAMMGGTTRLDVMVREFAASGKLTYTEPPLRPNHTAVV